MMHYTDDPAADAAERDYDFEKWLEHRPICDICGEPVTDDHYYSDGCVSVCCPDCWGQYVFDNFVVDIEEI